MNNAVTQDLRIGRLWEAILAFRQMDMNNIGATETLFSDAVDENLFAQYLTAATIGSETETATPMPKNVLMDPVQFMPASAEIELMTHEQEESAASPGGNFTQKLESLNSHDDIASSATETAADHIAGTATIVDFWQPPLAVTTVAAKHDDINPPTVFKNNTALTLSLRESGDDTEVIRTTFDGEKQLPTHDRSNEVEPLSVQRDATAFIAPGKSAGDTDKFIGASAPLPKAIGTPQKSPRSGLSNQSKPAIINPTEQWQVNQDWLSSIGLKEFTRSRIWPTSLSNSESNPSPKLFAPVAASDEVSLFTDAAMRMPRLSLSHVFYPNLESHTVWSQVAVDSSPAQLSNKLADERLMEQYPIETITSTMKTSELSETKFDYSTARTREAHDNSLGDQKLLFTTQQRADEGPRQAQKVTSMPLVTRQYADAAHPDFHSVSTLLTDKASTAYTTQFTPLSANHIVNWLVKKAQMVMENGRMEVDLRLEPQVLGKMKVRMEIVADVLTTHMEVQSTAAKEIVESQLPTLQHRLLENGIRVEKMEIALAPTTPRSDAQHATEIKTSGFHTAPEQQRHSQQPRRQRSSHRSGPNNFLDFIA